MELHLTTEVEADLARIARLEGKTTEELLTNVAHSLIEGEHRHLEIVRERVARADEGIFIEQDEMDRRFHKMLQR